MDSTVFAMDHRIPLEDTSPPMVEEPWGFI